MVKLYILTHKDSYDRVLDTLHKMGVVEVSDVRFEELAEMLHFDREHEGLRKIMEYEGMVKKALNFLHRCEGRRKKKLEVFFPKPKPKLKAKKLSEYAFFAKHADIVEKMCDEVLAVERKIGEIEERISLLRAAIKTLKSIERLDFDMKYLVKHTFFTVKVGISTDIGKIMSIAKKYGAHVYYESYEEYYAVLIITYKKDDSSFYGELGRDLFREVRLPPFSGKPRSVIEKLNSKLRDMRREIEKLYTKGLELAKKYGNELRVYHDEIINVRMKREASLRAGRTESARLISGWCPQKIIKKVRNGVLSADSGAYFYYRKPREGEEVPILINNPKWARPYQRLTEMYALPNYNEFDPTVIITPAFILFFALMLGDAFYGILVTIIGVLLYKGLGQVDEGMRDYAKIFIVIGIATIIAGLLLGSFLGPLDEYNPLTPALTSLGISRVIVLDSMKNPIAILLLSLILGLLQLNIGIALALIKNLRERKIKEALNGQVSWIFLEPAGFVLITRMLGFFTFSDIVIKLAYMGVLIGMILLFVPKGPLAFFDLTGFIGNFLSYARILALGLATSGIALTINIISRILPMFASSFICLSVFIVMAVIVFALSKKMRIKKLGYISIFFVIMGVISVFSVFSAIMVFVLLVLVFGHMFNAGIQALGAFIHSLRLQYVEFFGQFYEGGGRKFNPLRVVRKYSLEVEK